jgi:hypothetical protein
MLYGAPTRCFLLAALRAASNSTGAGCKACIELAFSSALYFSGRCRRGVRLFFTVRPVHTLHTSHALPIDCTFAGGSAAVRAFVIKQKLP